MEDHLFPLSLTSWEEPIPDQVKDLAIQTLEAGKVIFLPQFPFILNQNENFFLDPSILELKSKNISYDIRTDRISGTRCLGNEKIDLKEMMRRYALKTKEFLYRLFPSYKPYLKQARTSFRPAEAAGRELSARKDDTRLHVDSFPANPTKGERILRFFSNVNPNGKPRVWRLGESFPKVAQKMAPRAKKPFPGAAFFLQLLRITKDYRTLYDHYMLQIHDAMKLDRDYQKNVPQQEVNFPAGSSWIVYTDQVSHAAMSGQFLFEQTFHLPPAGLLNKESSPQFILESFFNKKLI